jgi:hypothetical protein
MGKRGAKRTARSVRRPEKPGAGKPKRAIPRSLSASLREAIRDSGVSPYQIARHAQLSQIVVYRFLSGERDIRLATADRLAEVLGLELCRASPGRRRRSADGSST